MKTRPEPTQNEQEAIIEDYIKSDDLFVDFADECFSKDSFLAKSESITFDEIPPAYVQKWLQRNRK